MVKEKYDIEISFTIINPPFEFSKDKNIKKLLGFMAVLKIL